MEMLYYRRKQFEEKELLLKDSFVKFDRFLKVNLFVEILF